MSHETRIHILRWLGTSVFSKRRGPRSLLSRRREWRCQCCQMNDDVFVTPADLHRLMHSDVGVTILDARHADFRHSGDEPGFSGTIPGNRIPAVGPPFQ